ncbi:hypothetical protein [Streptosporangium sp. NPDC002607]
MRKLDDLGSEHGIPLPISVSGTRVKLLALILLAVLALVSDSPEWITLVLILTSVAIPPAVAVLGGPAAVRALFLLPPRPFPPDTIRKEDLI